MDDLNQNDKAAIEHNWVKKELEWCDRQRCLHFSEDKRALHTIDKINAYSRQLRDYTTIANGIAKILTDKPFIG